MKRYRQFKIHRVLPAVILLCGITLIVCFFIPAPKTTAVPVQAETGEETKDFIKWVDFNVPLNAMQKAGQADIDTYSEDIHVNWIDALACLSAKYGGNWKQYKASELETILKEMKEGKTAEELLSYNQSAFKYYQEAYDAVLGGFIGLYQVETAEGNVVERYGVKVFSPIAAGYGYSHYRDFLNSRSYGFARPHVGNDLLGNTGTPIVAVESGTIECLGWNQYGGWRIGIRSLDKKRYYYYAHLKSGHPYVDTLKEGDTVLGGDVIGYLGMTGYSTKEDTNGMTKPHLHFGLQLIFDESQKDCNSEIWVDVYDIVNFLYKHGSEVTYNEESGEHERKYGFNDIID